MRKRIPIFLLTIISTFMLFTACGAISTYQDGIYTAEFENFDSEGYKDMIQVTVEDGEVVKIVYDAVNENGEFKSYDEKYAQRMIEFQGTSPEKYSKDLVNQFMASKGIDGVDSVAGATYSSRSFVTLYIALDGYMSAQNESLLVVPNVPEG